MPPRSAFRKTTFHPAVFLFFIMSITYLRVNSRLWLSGASVPGSMRHPNTSTNSLRPVPTRKTRPHPRIALPLFPKSFCCSVFAHRGCPAVAGQQQATCRVTGAGAGPRRWGSYTKCLIQAAFASIVDGVIRLHHMKKESTMHQESSIFKFDGQNFIRIHTTLRTEAGESAVGTKLDPNNPGFPALMQKHSYTGEVTLFGHQCEANYAPLTDQDGRLTGALMVCTRK